MNFGQATGFPLPPVFMLTKANHVVTLALYSTHKHGIDVTQKESKMLNNSFNYDVASDLAVWYHQQLAYDDQQRLFCSTLGCCIPKTYSITKYASQDKKLQSVLLLLGPVSLCFCACIDSI